MTNSRVCLTLSLIESIALFTVSFRHLHDNVIERGCEAISGKKCKISRNCLTSTFKYIVMQMTKGNCEKGYYGDIKAILTSWSADEILWCDYSNETSSAVLSHGTIYI